MSNAPPHIPSRPFIVVLPVAPCAPKPSHRDVDERIDHWTQQYERAALQNGWTQEQSLQNVYFSLEATARNWCEHHEATVTTSMQG